LGGDNQLEKEKKMLCNNNMHIPERVCIRRFSTPELVRSSVAEELAATIPPSASARAAPEISTQLVRSSVAEELAATIPPSASARAAPEISTELVRSSVAEELAATIPPSASARTAPKISVNVKH
jgi:hypothetical protein